MTYKKKLIEVALPLNVINSESGREKNIRQGHPFAIHHWWARRPLVSARALLWASLIDDPSSRVDLFPTEIEQAEERLRLFEILERLGTWEAGGDEVVLREARQEIDLAVGGDSPTIVDPFSGFGTIAIEAQRLGLDALAGDLNPVAVLVSKASVEVVPRFSCMPPVNPGVAEESGLKTWNRAQGLAEDVRHYGEWMRDQAFERIGYLYPKSKLPAERGGGDATVIAWLWARTVQSPDPSWDGHVPLLKSWVLRKPKSKPPAVWLVPTIDQEDQTVQFDLATSGEVPHPTIKRAKGTCIATGSPIPDQYIKEEGAAGRIGTQLMAVALEGDRGRVYVPGSEADAPPNPPPPTGAPSLRLSTHSQYMGPPLYGYSDVEDLFTSRQLTTLMTFTGLMDDVRRQIEADARVAGLPDDAVSLRDGGRGAKAYAEAVSMFLAFAIDKLADLGNAFCRWEPVAQCPRQLFGRQAVSMIWDFAEANPFSTSSGSWKVIIDGIVRAFGSVGFPSAAGEGEVRQVDAASLLETVSDAVVFTDPPYYDNIPYADLSDFFYVWLRRSLREDWPDILSTLATPKAEELVADRQRFGGKEAADAHFESGMKELFEVARSAQSPDYPMVIYYAFRQSEKLEEGVLSTGWQTFLQGILDSGLAVVSTWPIRTESAGRLRAHKSNALASSIVLALRPRADGAPLATRSEFLNALRRELPEAVRLLQKESIAPVDMAQSAIGPGMGVFSRYSKVVEADGSAMTVRQALASINEVLEEVLSEEETEFDADTRWALTWFEQYGLNPGPSGDANVLATAKGTSIAGVVHAGIAAQSGGTVRLLDRTELDGEWDPAEDSRLTVWEVARYLIAALDDSEVSAAELLRHIGSGMGERARMLAYLLFQAADRRGWSSEAVVYNGLVLAWRDLSRLAVRSSEPIQQSFGE